eukprot:TRINITY_DN6916_c0_g1_i3.p1 TRINITY_DN6916_c0_g1~~TRINITY_DN6916_c0_g1_i3.p1  ORF type:complete len:339 (-),score=59.59 TRINITY_DN6916_c0_g1_i3:39-1055(-)
MKKVPPFKFVYLNAMSLTEPKQAYSQFLKNLTCREKMESPAAALLRLNRMFASKKNITKAAPVVLAIDELDMLVTKNQAVLYNFFEWTLRMNSVLTIVAISNTMNLLDMMVPRVASRVGKRRIMFNPYHKEQLTEIIHSRLQDIHAFDMNAIKFAAARVASVSGDARRALELCRRAAILAEEEHQEGEEERITTHHVDRGINEMFTSTRTKLLKSLSWLYKLFLCSIIIETRYSGNRESTLKAVANRYSLIVRKYNLGTIFSEKLIAIPCEYLDQTKVIVTGEGTYGPSQKILLNVSDNDVLFAFEDDPLLTAILNGEHYESSDSFDFNVFEEEDEVA